MDEPSRRPVAERSHDMAHCGRPNSGSVSHTACCTCDSAFFDTLAREFLMLISMGRPEDIQLALRRREQREAKSKKGNVANLTEVQCVRGKAVPRGNRGTPWKKAPNGHPPSAIQKGGNAAMYYEGCELCGNRWQHIPLTMTARDSKTTKNNRTVLSSTGKRRVEIERPSSWFIKLGNAPRSG